MNSKTRRTGRAERAKISILTKFYVITVRRNFLRVNKPHHAQPSAEVSGAAYLCLTTCFMSIDGAGALPFGHIPQSICQRFTHGHAILGHTLVEQGLTHGTQGLSFVLSVKFAWSNDVGVQVVRSNSGFVIHFIPVFLSYFHFP